MTAALEAIKNAEYRYQVLRQAADASWTEYALDDQPDPDKRKAAELADERRNQAWIEREAAYIATWAEMPDPVYLQHAGRADVKPTDSGHGWKVSKK